jgi:hypothetical protein
MWSPSDVYIICAVCVGLLLLIFAPQLFELLCIVIDLFNNDD